VLSYTPNETQTHRQRNTETDCDNDRHTERHMYSDTARQTDRWRV